MVWRPFLVPRFELATQPIAEPPTLPRGHIPALDALRGLAIVLVTLWRFGGGGSEAAAVALPATGLMNVGSRGVDLFFVLSGFLITGILFDAKEKSHYFRDFYVRRALRIFPLYYVTLTFVLILAPLVLPGLKSTLQSAIDRQLWLWPYGGNLQQAVEDCWCLGPLNHFWSLAIEEHFYLLWPAVIFIAPRRQAIRICGVVGGASLVARMVWLASGGSDIAAEVLTPLRMDGLALGSWLALAARGPGGLAWLVRLARPMLLVAAPLALLADLLGRRLFGLPGALWGCTFAGLLVLIVAAPKHARLGRLGHSTVLRFFGKYSYGMYVFQLPLIYLLAPLVTARGLAAVVGQPWLGQAMYCALLFAITTLAAMISWHGFEKHVLKLKHYFGGA